MKKKILITCLAAFITIYTVPVIALAATQENYILETEADGSAYEQLTRQDDIGYSAS